MVDIMSRYSVNNLKKKVDHQRKIDEIKRAYAHKQIMLTDQSKFNNELSKVQSVNDASTVALPEQHMSEMLASQHDNQPDDEEEEQEVSLSDHDSNSAAIVVEQGSPVPDYSADHQFQLMEPNIAADSEPHPILYWNKEKGLYLTPLSDQVNNEGQAILTEKSIGIALRAVGKALKKLHKNGESHGRIDLEHICVDANNEVSLLPHDTEKTC